MSDDLQTLDSEIHRLRQEAAGVERAGPTFDERWPEIESQLLESENVFRRIGTQLGGFVSELPEHVHQRRQALVGMALVANKKAVIDAERTRIKAETANGIAVAERARRLNELKRATLRIAAKRELLVRASDVEGEFLPRPPLHAELTVFRRAVLEELAR